MRHLARMLAFVSALSPVVGWAQSSDFLSLCKLALSGKTQAPKVCGQLNQKFFSKVKTHDIAPFTPSQVNAPAMSVDKKIEFIVFNDPNFLSSVAYCYFVHRNWIDPQQISPDDLGLNSSGFSILNEDLKGYQKWLDTTVPGKNCKARVEKISGVPTANLEESLSGHTALIAINPLASVRTKGANFDAVMSDLELTVNHERVHAYQALCPDFDKWSLKQWLSASPLEKAKTRGQYSSYNWSDLKVAGREYTAFALEAKPQDLARALGKCAP